jgi:beta-lactamase regulating signal transducer with metallopeptidase domain/Leucine-rich repeat (LRR) protein
MDEVVNLLNAAGGTFVAFAFRMLVQSGLLIVALAVLDLLLRNRVKAVVRYWIWLLVLAKLVLPPSFSLPTGVAYWVPGPQSAPPAPAAAMAPAPSVSPAGPVVISPEPGDPEFAPVTGHVLEGSAPARTVAAPAIIPPGPALTWQALALLGWAVCMAVMAVLLLRRTRFVRGLVAQSHEAPPEIIELLRLGADRMGVRTPLAVKISPFTVSPSVCGLRRPVILVPQEMLVRLHTPELRSVLLHELAHIQRGDLWLNLLQALLQIVYFYHPLLWAANGRIRRVREQAVDETVLAGLGEEAEDYPRTLLRVSRLAFGPPALSLRLLGVVESRQALTERICHIASRPFPKSAKPGWAGCVLVALAAATLLPMARATSRTPAGRAADPAMLETIRGLVAHNEALINPIKLDFTVETFRDEMPPQPTGGRIPGRRPSLVRITWAQRGSKQYVKYEPLYEANEPGRNTVTILDERTKTQARGPDRMEGTVSSVDSFDYSDTLPGRLEMRPLQGQQVLLDLLVPEYATVHPDTEVVEGRPAYVIDVSMPLVFWAAMRIWLDCEAGVPVRVQHLDRHPTIPQAQVHQEVSDVSLYRLPNGGWIPSAGITTFHARLGDVRRVRCTRLCVDINSVRTGADDLPESLFEIDFPPGATVYDARSGLTSIVGQPVKTYQQIVEGGGRFVAGTVGDESGAPAPGVAASAVMVTTPQVARMLRPAPCAMTDAEGRFALELPEEGTYTLWFRHPDLACAELGQVPAGQRGLKVTLDEGGTITGRVVRMVNGGKVPVANLEVVAAAPNTFTLRGGQIRTRTDAEGRFEFRGLDVNKRRPRFGREQELAYDPISWQIRCGRTAATVQFERGVHTQDVELVLRPDPAVAPSLVGRKLPGFEDLGTSLQPEDVQGKAVLVCFFDLNQRPTRHCVDQLLQKAQELKDKGIVVIAVQAVEAEPDTLAAWRQESHVPFAVGALREDIPERRYAWSARSLPWLILADRDHTVRAEGFAPDELEQKIAFLVGTAPPKSAEAEPARVVHFPKEISLGRLDIRDRGSQRWQDWTAWGTAKGDVAVPAGKELRLSLYEAYEHRSRLASLAPDDLQELYLSSRELSDADLDYIKGLTGLESLHLSGTYAGPCPLTGQGLANLRGMTKLRRLMLDFTSITDDQLTHLAALKTLETLQLHRNRNLIGDGLVHLQGLKSLRELRFYVTPIEDDGLKHLEPLTSLEVLSLQSTHVSDAGLAHLEKLPRLRELVLPAQLSDDGLTHVGKLASLRKLFVYSPTITDAGLEHLKNLPALQSLTLCSPKVTRRGIEPLRAARPALKLELSLRFTSDAEMACLKELPYVTALILLNAQVSDGGLAPLAGLTSLRYLNLRGTGVTDAGLLPLENLRAIDNLDLDATTIGDEGLAHLKHLAALETLRLHGTRVTDAGLAHLAAMKSLVMLFLGSTDVADAGLVHLKDMTKLSVLFLRYTKVTGPGLAHLTGLTSLRHLDLSGAPLTDAAVEHLKQMKHLQVLSISTAGMSEGAVEELRRALPDCTIRVSSN